MRVKVVEESKFISRADTTDLSKEFADKVTDLDMTTGMRDDSDIYVGFWGERVSIVFHQDFLDLASRLHLKVVINFND